MKKELNLKLRNEFLDILKTRIEKNTLVKEKIEWKNLEAKLIASPEKLWSLYEMDKTGGEPNLISWDKKSGDYIFYDCSAESPAGRRSLCYDKKALDSRKENKPKNNALDLAASMGISILSEAEYRNLQALAAFDLKTSSWVLTPDKIRKLGGAIFCDRRYDTIFTYHNGAESYYAARGFRGKVIV